MNENIVLIFKDKRIFYENHDYIWLERPYKFMIGPVKPSREISCAMHKDIEIHLVTNGSI